MPPQQGPCWVVPSGQLHWYPPEVSGMQSPVPQSMDSQTSKNGRQTIWCKNYRGKKCMRGFLLQWPQWLSLTCSRNKRPSWQVSYQLLAWSVPGRTNWFLLFDVFFFQFVVRAKHWVYIESFPNQFTRIWTRCHCIIHQRSSCFQGRHFDFFQLDVSNLVSNDMFDTSYSSADTKLL